MADTSSAAMVGCAGCVGCFGGGGGGGGGWGGWVLVLVQDQGKLQGQSGALYQRQASASSPSFCLGVAQGWRGHTRCVWSVRTRAIDCGAAARGLASTGKLQAEAEATVAD